MDRAGIEPARHGFSVPESGVVEGQPTNDTPITYENTADSATGSAQQKAQQIDPNLAQIVAAWPKLPDAIRRAMLALIG